MLDSSLSGRAKRGIGSDDGRLPRSVIFFSIAYTFVASVFAFATGNREFVFYIVVMLVLATVIAIVHQRVSLTRGLLWCLSIWGLLHMAGGLVPVPEAWQTGGPILVLYSLWLIPGVLKYDQLIHLYGFGITTWLCWEALRAHLVANGWRTGHGDSGPPEPVPRLGLMTLCAAGGMGFGAFNEVVEFIATLTIPNTNVGGYENTGWDLVFNLIGSVFAACLISWKGKRKLEGLAVKVPEC